MFSASSALTGPDWAGSTNKVHLKWVIRVAKRLALRGMAHVILLVQQHRATVEL